MTRATPFLSDPDVTLHHGDALQVLRELPDESVDCVVTSPPYWSLRDYGTGTWEGGDAGCDHGVERLARRQAGRQTDLDGGVPGSLRDKPVSECSCGATRIDRQLGLEPTPEEYVERMVEVFREVRRVLAAHGTCWVNLGDSYNSNPSWGRGRTTLEGRPQDQIPNSNHNKKVISGLKEKDLVGIPWRVAFALQADGWYLRSDIIWSKPNPMPESVTDRPTKAHEYLFLLSKAPRYFFDQEAVREPAEWARWGAQTYSDNGSAALYGGRIKPRTKAEVEAFRDRSAAMGRQQPGNTPDRGGVEHRPAPGGRNIRSVWEIATQPFPEAHFATFPEELVRRCIAAGTSEKGKCQKCGASWVRVEKKWKPGCACQKPHTPHTQKPTPVWATYPPIPCVVLDPFAGSGTVGLVARKHGRRAVLIELSEPYCAMAARRLQQQSLFATEIA